MPTTTGPISSYADYEADPLVAEAMAKRSVGRPSVAVRDKKEPKFAFISNGRRELRLRIAPLPLDYRLPSRAAGKYVLDRAADDARTAAAIGAARDVYLQFHRRYATDAKGKSVPTNDGVLLTDSEPVADWLRHRIRQRVFRESRISEDFSLLDVPCQYRGQGCEFSYRNTDAGKAAYADHLVEEHFKPSAGVDDDDGGVDGPDLDAVFANAIAAHAVTDPLADHVAALTDEAQEAFRARKAETLPQERFFETSDAPKKRELTPEQREARLAGLAKGRATRAANLKAATNADEEAHRVTRT